MRLAYADPPYVGLAERYYGSHQDYGGEVDHGELIGRLATSYDGWALSCSSSSAPRLLAIALAYTADVRLAIWHRRRAAVRQARRQTAWEGVLYVAARSPVEYVEDVLLDVDARQRPTLPSSVVGMKPPRFAEWVFVLIGARPGDTLEDLYRGSGLVERAWHEWSGSSRPTAWERAARGG